MNLCTHLIGQLGMGPAAITPKLAWYVSRASGIVSWVLLVLSILWGLVLSARVLNKATAPGWLLDLHRFLGAACLALTGVHLAALVADNWVYFGWRELFVPFASKWRTGAVNWGIASLYILLLVEVTSLLRKRIGRRLWRATHYLSFLLFGSATVHGIQAGHDRNAAFYGWMTAAGVSVFVTLTIIRIVAARTKKDRTSNPRTSAATQPRIPDAARALTTSAAEGRSSAERGPRLGAGQSAAQAGLGGAAMVAEPVRFRDDADHPRPSSVRQPVHSGAGPRS